MDQSSTSGVARPLAVVTGASTGIGFELARQFAGNGFDLVICADEPQLLSSAEELRGMGAEVRAEQADLATGDGVRDFYRAVEGSGRPVAAAAINAGVGVNGRFDEVSLEDDLRLIAVNVTSSVHLAKLLCRHMVANGSGRLLFTSSIAATMPGPFFATYAASKAFLQSFAEALRNELKDTGVTVTSLMPGPTDTQFFDRAGMQGTRVDSGPKDDPAEVAADGFRALMAGEDKVVAGSFKNKVQVAAARVLPEPVKAAVHRRQTEPGSGTE